MPAVGSPRCPGRNQKVAVAVVECAALLTKAHDKAALDVGLIRIKGHEGVHFVGTRNLFVLLAPHVNARMVVFMRILLRTVGVCPPHVFTGEVGRCRMGIECQITLGSHGARRLGRVRSWESPIATPGAVMLMIWAWLGHVLSAP